MPTDPTLTDWEESLGAVTARLRIAVDEPFGRHSPTSARVRAGVLECVIALDRLHMNLRDELGDRHWQALELFDVRTSLAQLRADLTSSRTLEQRHGHRAPHDQLSLLPNREHFLQRLEQVLARDACDRKGLAVLVIGLKGFRPGDDAQGEGGGEQVLRIVAMRVSRALRGSDMVGDLGDDKLACLLPGFDAHAQLRHLACKLYDTVAAPMKIGRHTRVVRPSIGIVRCLAEVCVAPLLLDQAQAAMTRASIWQTGYAFYDPALDD